MNSITVCVCTFNRKYVIEQVLSGLKTQTINHDRFETIIVDNASTDDTHAIIQRWQTDWKTLHYVFEPIQGLSYARNRALAETSTPIIAFLDDDAIPEPTWLEAHLAIFNDPALVPAAVGGRIWLRWSNGEPTWMHPELWWLFSYYDYGDELRPIHNINGANMVFRTDVLRAYGGFDVRLGLQGERQIVAEESQLLFHMREAGERIYYQPKALVWHLVRSERETPAYLFKRSAGMGYSDALRRILFAKVTRLDAAKLIVKATLNKPLTRLHTLLTIALRQSVIMPDAVVARCNLASYLSYIGLLGQCLVVGQDAIKNHSANKQ